MTDTTEKQVESEGKNTDRSSLYEKIGKLCDEYGLSDSCFMSDNPDNSSDPIIFIRGDKLTIARITAIYTRLVRREINQELSTS